MAQTRILVVKDKEVITRDLKNRLKGLGYPSPATASSGTEAIKKAIQYHPDLLLIDIQLKGAVDGIKAAKLIHDRFDIPVIYLMEDADEEALRNEKVIEPFYFILKPFKEDSLHLSIERALYKHKMGRLRKYFNELPTGQNS